MVQCQQTLIALHNQGVIFVTLYASPVKRVKFISYLNHPSDSGKVDLQAHLVRHAACPVSDCLVSCRPQDVHTTVFRIKITLPFHHFQFSGHQRFSRVSAHVSILISIFLGFVSPCIIIHSNKSTNQMHQSLRFIARRSITAQRVSGILLPIIRSL